MSLDVLHHGWVLWGLLGFEALLLLLGAIFRSRVRFSVTLLIGSLVANLVFGLRSLDSIYTNTGLKVFIGAIWPLLNLAWLAWVWRSRGGKRAEAPRPMKQPTQAAAAAAPEVSKRATLRKPSDVAPRAGSTTLDLRPDVKKEEDAKRK